MEREEILKRAQGKKLDARELQVKDKSMMWSYIEMRYEDENIWLTQKMMAVLYNVSLPTINEHIKKIYADGELAEESTIRKFRIVQEEGTRKVNRELTHYNLQMIIAVGFNESNMKLFRQESCLFNLQLI